MNCHALHILNDKLQSRIQSENLPGIRNTLFEMLEELGKIEARKAVEEYAQKVREDNARLEGLTKGVK